MARPMFFLLGKLHHHMIIIYAIMTICMGLFGIFILRHAIDPNKIKEASDGGNDF